MKAILLIYNPKAGDTTFRFSLDRFIEIFSKKAYEIRIFRSCRPGDMAEYLLQADLTSVGAIMVAGGTGTVSEVVGAVVGQKIALPVGIIPAGTENELAKYLGFTGDLEENLKALYEMHEGRVDVGKIGDQYFVDLCGAGTFSSISNVSTDIRTAFGKIASYMKGAVSFQKLKSRKLYIETGGKRYIGTFSSFIAANEALYRDGSLSEGTLTFVATRGNMLGGEGKYLGKDYQDEHDTAHLHDNHGVGEIEKGVLRLVGTEFKIEAESDDPLPMEIDGESGLMQLPMTITVLPAALRVFYSPEGRDALFLKKRKAKEAEDKAQLKKAIKKEMKKEQKAKKQGKRKKKKTA